MQRRSSPRWLDLTVATLSALALAACSGKPTAERPNIVLFLADDLGYADLGVQGSQQVRSPHIDSLASDGIRFLQAYVTSPVCAPSRAGLLTGRYPQRAGVHRNRHDLPSSETTIAEILRSAGYRTGMVGKWHLGSGDMAPTRQGFDEYVGFHHLAAEYEAEVGEYLPEYFARQATAFIERHRAEPFFLYVAFSAPHAPVRAPDQYLDRFPDIEDPMRKAYVAMVAAMDDAVGAVLDTLRRLSLDEQTIVVFLNDNGGPGTDSHAAALNASLNTPLRGFKQDLYEGGIRVPCFLRWPARIQAGTTFDRVVSAMDLLPTLVNAAGVTPPAGLALDGVDLMPYVDGARKDSPHPWLFWKHHETRAVRHDDWKLVEIDGGVELFDLGRDEREQKDLAAAHPEVVRSLSQALQAWNAGLGPLGELPPEDAR